MSNISNLVAVVLFYEHVSDSTVENMTERHTVRSGALMAEIHSVIHDVDEDDRDILKIVISVTNESAIPMGQLRAEIKTTKGQSYTPTKGVSSVGPGLTRNYHFILSDNAGHWVFELEHNNADVRECIELGPVKADLRIDDELEEYVQTGQTVGSAVGGGLFEDVFSSSMGDFGKQLEPINLGEIEFEGTPLHSTREIERKDPIVEEPEEIVSNKVEMSKAVDLLNTMPLSTSSGLTSNNSEEVRSPPPTQKTMVREAPPISLARTEQGPLSHSPTSASVRDAPLSSFKPPGSSGPPASGPPAGPPASGPPAGPPAGPPQDE